jgi:hypothetical protein
VAAVAAAGLELDGVERDVELVVDEHDAFGGNVVETRASCDTGPPDTFM